MTDGFMDVYLGFVIGWTACHLLHCWNNSAIRSDLRAAEARVDASGRLLGWMIAAKTVTIDFDPTTGDLTVSKHDDSTANAEVNNHQGPML